jgi:glutamate formiminotransferase
VLVSPINISEGRDLSAIAALTLGAGSGLLDVHRDAHHNRSVFTLAGTEAVRTVAAEAVRRLDLRHHEGVHPRFGVVDVVPFVPFGESTMDDALRARDDFARWLTGTLEVPTVRYGFGQRSLPEVRRAMGEVVPHPTAGVTAVGARAPLVAYNVWLADPDVALAKRVASAVRSPELRALGLPVGDRVQVSMNLVAPEVVGPADAYDAVAALAPVAGAELVGLVPQAVLFAVPAGRWAELDLAPDRTVEGRLRR